MTTDRFDTSSRVVPGDPVMVRDAHIARLRRQVDELTASAELLTVRDAEVATLRARLEAVLASRLTEIEHLERRVNQLEALLAEASERARHAEALEASLTDAERRLRATGAAAERAAEAAEHAASSRPGADGDLAGAHARIASLEAALATRPQPAQMGYGFADASFRSRLEDRVAVWRRLFERRISEQHEALVEKEQIIAGLLAPEEAESVVDPADLTQVNGIGASIAEILGSLGYTRLEDIAALGPSDLDEIDEALGSFKGRAQRDGWADQAGELLRRASNRTDQAIED